MREPTEEEIKQENEKQERIEKFQKELEGLINKYSLENLSNTPDYILAEYMVNSVFIFNYYLNLREKLENKEEI